MGLLWLFVAIGTLALARSHDDEFAVDSDNGAHACNFSGDPHATLWHGEHGSFPYPCHFKAAHLLVKIGREKYMEIVVVASSSMRTIKGRYFIDYASVSMTFKTGKPPNLIDEETATFTISAKSIDENPETAWTDSSGGALVGEVETSYKKKKRLGILRLRSGKVRILFRPPKKNAKILQKEKPGVFLLVGKERRLRPLPDDPAKFPKTICSNVDDTVTIEELRKEKGLSFDQLLLWAALGQDLEQPKGICKRTIKAFSACSDDDKKVAAVKECEKYTKPKNVKRSDCVRENGRGFRAFSLCIRASCGDADDKEKLKSHLEKMADGC